MIKSASVVCMKAFMTVWHVLCSIILHKKSIKDRNSAVYGPWFWKHIIQWNKKSLFARYKWNHFLVLSEKPRQFLFFNKIFWPKVSRIFWRSIESIPIYFPFWAPFKIKFVNRDKLVSLEHLALNEIWLINFNNSFQWR